MNACVICNSFFIPSRYYPEKKTCSKNCFAKIISLNQKGKSFLEEYGEEKAKQIILKQTKSRKNFKHSEKTIQKLKQIKKGKTYDQMYGVEKANIIKEKQKIKSGLNKKGKTREQIYGREMADKITQNLKQKLSGRIFRRKCKGFYYNNKFFRSSWEKQFAIYCDKNNIQYEYEPKMFDLGQYRYIPDFYMPQMDMWVEIKGWWKQQDVEKCKLFKEQITPRLFIIDETNYRFLDENYNYRTQKSFNLIGEYNIPLISIKKEMVSNNA